ncbi:MAG: FkbM family methyltransferase [Bacteroidales bacterium]|nr:FkbM family methyltransferase [Bacteroidales bacterium]
MLRLVRIILLKLLGVKSYLRIISSIYIKLINMGWGKSKYPELHYLKNIINLGYNCIDIGANMGYYSYFLSKYSGPTGKIYAIEPVPLFCKIWEKNTSKTKFKNLTLFPFALGEKDSHVEMGTPMINGILHHGMTKIITKNDSGFNKTFTVEMKNPENLFSEIQKIDFIKIDVEGYESIVVENMIETIRKHKPLIQSELSGAENRLKVIKTITDLGYSVNYLKGNHLELATPEIVNTYQNDFYFKPN